MNNPADILQRLRPGVTPTVDLTCPSQRGVLADNIRDAARLLGARGGSTLPSSDHSGFRPRNPPGIHSWYNRDYCGMRIPGFMSNQNRDRDSSMYNRNLIRGKYSNGKKEVIRKSLYAIHGTLLSSLRESITKI